MSGLRIEVSVARQELALRGADGRRRAWPVSTSRHGCGQRLDSHQTPLGRHCVRAKIGDGLPAGSVLVGRRPTGEVKAAADLAPGEERDWITSRILWLSGLEPGFNRLGAVDSMQRYIYIHGTPHEAQLGRPGSIGCVRMGDEAVIELYRLVPAGTLVEIRED